MEPSYYHGKFRQGAELSPHWCWFVDFVSELPDVTHAPYLESNDHCVKEPKKQWQFKWQGRIEKEFLFETVRAKALLPFTVQRSQLVFLPLMNHGDGIRILQADELLKNGKLYAAQWLKGVRQASKTLSTNKSCPTENLARNQALSTQDPKKKMVVLYNGSGSQPSAALYTSDCKPSSHETNGFIADHETYFYYPDSSEEGDYLCAILNSKPVINGLSNLRSSPSVRKKVTHCLPFEFVPVPRFDLDNPTHLSLAELGKECRIALKPSGNQVHKPRNCLSERQLARNWSTKINKAVASVLR